MDTVLVQLVGEAVGAKARGTEHQYLLPVAILHQVGQQFALAFACHGYRDVGHGLRDRVPASNLDQHRITQEGISEFLDLFREGGREQKILALLGQQADDTAHIGHESHVHHAVRFVENKELDLREMQYFLLHMVQQAAGRGHKDLHPAPQRLGLRVHRHPAIDDRCPQWQVLAIHAHALFDLNGQFARRGQDQRPHWMPRRRCAGVRVRGQLLQDRQRESGGLARPGLRSPHQVAPLEDQGNRLRLDRRGFRIALFEYRLLQFGQKTQFSKCRHREPLASGQAQTLVSWQPG